VQLKFIVIWSYGDSEWAESHSHQVPFRSGLLAQRETFLINPSKFRYLKPRPDQPKVLRNPEFRHGFLPLYDGSIRIHYAEAGDPNKPLLLFIHGFPEFWYTWQHQLRAFRNDYHVVAIDLRGYGESSKPQSVGDYHLSKLVEDIRQSVAALGNGKCFLVSHDWGASLSWRFTIKYPEMVKKLVICSAPHPVAMQNRAFVKKLINSWYVYFFQCPYLPEITLKANDMELLEKMLTTPPAGCTSPDAFTQDDIEAWKYTFQQPGALTAPINYYRSAIPQVPAKTEEPTGPAEQNLGSEKSSQSESIVKPPTLIIWGSEDVALETALAQASLQFCQQGQLKVIEGASHWVQQDRPELCNQYIRDFLRA